MHPIVGHRRRLGLYAIAWIPLMLLLGYLLKAAGLSNIEAATLMLPLAPLYAVMCLAAWYPTRATPLQTAGFTRLVATQLTAAVLVSSAWMFVALLYSYLLSLTEGFQNIRDHAALDKIFFGVGVLFYLLSVAVHYVLAAMQKSQEAEQHANEAKLLARDAELRALKAQINPHFLFNSLNSISALTTIDPLKAREMCITLADFLRSTLGLGEKALIPLDEELSLVRRFLSVEQIRFGSRLQIEETVDASARNCLLPPLLLQPLVENAIAHGIANLPEGGWIKINVTCHDSRLSLTVENNFDPDYKPKRSRGIGMSNVRERLLTRYGKQGNFNARTEADCFQVSISLPAERSAQP